MNFLFRTVRTASAAFRIKACTSVRYYANEAPAGLSDRLRLSFALPHQTIYANAEVQQVNIASTAGDMGILANHVPSIEQLKPGIVEILENPTTIKRYFASGGFAMINPNSSLDINAIEAFPLEDFSLEAIRTNLAEAQRIASTASTEEEKAEARIEVEVYEALQSALSK
ncbi:epsilon subunit of F1F0-ATP synthase N-terminal domain-containing protein [Rhizophagus irregularis]|uniref:ATP synthase subunit delta, mitochondrial n=2 Tax=Rhizophagus irregularis TaxID=588596 RepID=U9UK51_RHIID|nr:F1 complex, delta/epsilon subunit of ATPase [Rhizophagus irregularis DAOM 181602=DAOM 197198]PKC15177.1 epsilon subunit of F1F0-ATP synthase N-terminal domain-containing protein [Rhizophagus irregularis]PKC76177.1 epsilon subunit of F1F0-ATP synthase N-terminal domain-containing protein [Rhizophagus irregularis]PKK73611.1 epsilon subunit of F1F0-ATP synthase N-terminal domain-containing protein [Rhizophagus irregularis]POG74538.1 F1 complex, delta/epsilon subunit of ATPase [Rhizophagus irreg|eukprot:XP_025181404.1 F1 complex, delta/epsilon subunit of ATPase [Rhizophagus irregularis DAOM 181602=DAOM 197198]